MDKFLIKIKKYSIVTIIVSAVLGILLIIKPNEMIDYASFFLGFFLIAEGILLIGSYIVKHEGVFNISLGIILGILGIVICFLHTQIIAIMIFILGLCLLCGGLTNLFSSVYIAISRHRSWLLTIILAVASIVLGILAMFNPFKSQETIVIIIGCGLVAFAVVELVAYIQVKVIAKEVKKDIEKEVSNIEGEQNATEVDYVEVDD